MDEKNQRLNEPEQQPADDAKISAMLSGLRRVEAPGDFEFHVRSRIAKGRPVEIASGSWLPQIKILVPAILVLIIGVFFGYSFLRTTGENSTVAAEAPKVSQPSVPAQSQPTLSAVPSNEPQLANNENRKPVRDDIVVVKADRKQLQKGGSRDESGGGSKDSAVKQPSINIMPRGISLDPVKSNANVADAANAAKITLSDILRQLGIEAEKTASGWRVKSAAASSTADRSGVKAGDLIQAIEDRELGSNPVFPGNITFKSLRVIREGNSLVIALQNR